jgi:hypothetical protein
VPSDLVRTAKQYVESNRLSVGIIEIDGDRYARIIKQGFGLYPMDNKRKEMAVELLMKSLWKEAEDEARRQAKWKV